MSWIAPVMSLMAKTPPFEDGIDLRVDQHDDAWLGVVFDDAGAGFAHPQLVALLYGVVDDPRLRVS